MADPPRYRDTGVGPDRGIDHQHTTLKVFTLAASRRALARTDWTHLKPQSLPARNSRQKCRAQTRAYLASSAC